MCCKSLQQDYAGFIVSKNKRRHKLIRTFIKCLDGTLTGLQYYNDNIEKVKTLSYSDAKHYIQREFARYLVSEYDEQDIRQLFEIVLTDKRVMKYAMASFYNLIKPKVICEENDMKTTETMCEGCRRNSGTDNIYTCNCNV
jgi:hypothetical protein